MKKALKFIAMNTITFLISVCARMCFWVTTIIHCHVCCFTETVQRNEDSAKQKKETALLQDEQRKLASNMDKLKDEVQGQNTDLHSQIVAAQS